MAKLAPSESPLSAPHPPGWGRLGTAFVCRCTCRCVLAQNASIGVCKQTHASRRTCRRPCVHTRPQASTQDACTRSPRRECSWVKVNSLVCGEWEAVRVGASWGHGQIPAYASTCFSTYVFPT